MIRVSLALALALGSLPACVSADEGIHRGGDCRPDIGPTGLLKLVQEGATRVAIMATPIENDSWIVLAKRRNGDSERLQSWGKYSIRIDFSAGTVSAAVWDDATGTKVLDLQEPAVTRPTARTIVLTDRNDANLNFNSPGTLKIYAENPTDSKWYVAAAYVTQEGP